MKARRGRVGGLRRGMSCSGEVPARSTPLRGPRWPDEIKRLWLGCVPLPTRPPPIPGRDHCTYDAVAVDGEQEGTRLTTQQSLRSWGRISGACASG